MLHSTETLDLATWPVLKAKSLSPACEIVLLTSSSFRTHVHLLHVVIVNQALQLCSFSSFPFAMCFSSAYSCVMYYHSWWKPTCLLNLSLSTACWIILTNIKQLEIQNTLLRWRPWRFFQSGIKPCLSAQKQQISHTSANGGVRLFVYFACLCLSFTEWVSDSAGGLAFMCVAVDEYVCWPSQWVSLNWYH